MKTLYSLLYVASFVALIAIMGHRNAEINRWIYKQELARAVMAGEEAGVEIDMEIRSVSL